MMIPSPILFGGCLYSAGAVLVEFILKEYRPSRILQKLVSFLRYSVFTTVRALLFYLNNFVFDFSFIAKSNDCESIVFL